MTVTIDHLSASQAGMWLRCPRQYSFRYWDGIKIPPSGALVLGSSYHKALEINYSQKIETKTDMPVDSVLDAFSDDWEKRLEDEESISWEGAIIGQMKDQAAGLIQAYQVEIAPTIYPTMVEHRCEAVVGGVPFVGIIDLVEGQHIVDHKTAAKSWTQDKLDSDIQATAYAFLMPSLSEINFHIAVKTIKPKIQILSTQRGAGDVLWWCQLVSQVIMQIQHGVAPPNPTGWHCSPTMCGYWQLCHKMLN